MVSKCVEAGECIQRDLVQTGSSAGLRRLCSLCPTGPVCFSGGRGLVCVPVVVVDTW